MNNYKRAREVLGGYRLLARGLRDEGLIAPDLPEPTVKDDGWVEWGGEVAFHPDEGLWSYDNGAMTLDSPDRLREVALIYLAAAKYAEENA
jgi:hypothetical protein